VLGNDAPLELPVLFESALALDQPLAAVARDWFGLGGAFGLERLLGLAQPFAPIAARAQPRWQLVAARFAVELVLGRVRGAASSRISAAICS
jgi:hypothetical protein